MLDAILNKNLIDFLFWTNFCRAQTVYHYYRCLLGNTFSKQREKGNLRKLSFNHIIVISTERTYLSITNQSG